MQIGIARFVTDDSLDVVSPARKAQACGFDSLRSPEHPITCVHTTSPFPGAADGVIPSYYAHAMDPCVALAAAAAYRSCENQDGGVVIVDEASALVKEVVSG